MCVCVCVGKRGVADVRCEICGYRVRGVSLM